ncbi:MAG: glycosyltransferase, partial [Prosthecobacter sp.]|nr:glycosyltransferase [Prosthecobacter sp.]
LGDGPLRDELNRAITELGLQASVTMPGFKQYDELPLCYATADAFIHASTTEQWGLVVNEAMAAGLPVLVSNRCGCAPDLVVEGRNGFSFDPFDIEAIARGMAAMAALPEDRRQAMGGESRKIIANWGPERFGQGLHDAGALALRAGPQEASIANKLLLKALLCR